MMQAMALLLVLCTWISLRFQLVFGQQCNACSTISNLACVSETEFQFCANGSPTGSIVACPSGYVCSTVNATICQLDQDDAVVSCNISTTVTTTVATTLSPAAFPQQYCRNLQQNGRFPVGTNANSTCRQYVLCFVRNNVWSGALYKCPGKLYFNSTSRLCEVAMPAECATQNTTLSLDFDMS